MSITLLCLLKGNTLANAFSVKISRDEPVSELKKVIKAEKQNDFAGVDADKLRLWNTEKPLKKHIHILFEPPSPTSASDEVLELREKLAAMQALLNKSLMSLLNQQHFLTEHFITVFEVVVKPKRTKGFKWTVNIEHASLEGLKNSIRETCPTPALENDGALLNVLNDDGKYSPRNDQDLRDLLQVFVSKNNLKFTVFIETPSKPFNEWTFPKVCELYGLSDDPNPSTDVYPVFSCGNNFKLIPEKLVEGRNGQGNLDYAVECRSTGRILGVIEVKKEDFMKGVRADGVNLDT
ncbi:hypothetical protein RhiirA1_542909 [Rhizophagus irregularis]|uniref:Crinkler effector protein N-terminal domain-containing protein n=1 Tax=Rhizophagus irregularis TaxID=588596 RepID=A0A2N0QTG7_9GLOM|nr:hypothetical protein RhiirA1_542909 [Rhizophagus irregularis]